MVLDRARKAYQTRGLVSPFPCAFEVTDGGLVIDTGRATMTAAWPAVSDLFVAGPYWIVLTEGTPHFLPKRFFASPAEEKAFLGQVLARMSPEARERSPEAVSAASS